ncbi:MAG TPA: ribosomal protein S18-alanine N-acetyltransferase [Lachnospiraceae bacterium]|nr:ribosomal protein S18-alanine N-acetyltransferase [Lachnospiraceae bacterium]
MIKIREMLESDIADIARIEEETFSMPWSADAFHDMLVRDNMTYLVIDLNGQIIGGAGIRNILGDAEITNVAIKKSYRNKGYGKRLINALTNKGYEMGANAFTLEVRKSNIPAILLYKSLGFTEEGLRKNFYEKPREDALIMWKRQSV